MTTQRGCEMRRWNLSMFQDNENIDTDISIATYRVPGREQFTQSYSPNEHNKAKVKRFFPLHFC